MKLTRCERSRAALRSVGGGRCHGGTPCHVRDHRTLDRYGMLILRWRMSSLLTRLSTLSSRMTWLSHFRRGGKGRTVSRAS